MKIKLVVVDLELSSRAKRLLAAVAVPLVVLGGGAVAYANVPHTWNDGDTLTAADLNGSFTSFDTRVAALEANALPPGTINAFGGVVVPAGWLLCDGAAVDRTANAALFAAIGIKFGGGDGVTTFNVPDLRGRVVMGAGAGPSLTPRSLGEAFGEETHTLTIGEMPAHNHGGVTGGISSPPSTDPGLDWAGSGALRAFPQIFVGATGSNYNEHTHSIAAEGGGAPHNVLPPSLVMNYVIKL